MTISEFRSIPTYTEHMRTVLADSIVQLALTTLIDSNKPLEALDHEHEIVSVRRHSRGVGFDTAIRGLLLMGESKPAEKKEGQEVPTYGTGISADSDFTGNTAPDSDILLTSTNPNDF